MMTSAD